MPVDELDAVVDDWSEQLAACAPAAAEGTLELIDASWNTTFTQALENEAVAQRRAVAALREQAAGVSE